jgi:precorrin-4/cobalt-precorrin-4 C11-methyltransferase
MNRVYFIGAGPGDPELLTLRGAALLQGCCAVFTFASLGAAFTDLLGDRPVYEPFDFSFADLQAKVRQLLTTGHVAFLVPGDPAFFSPFQALMDALGERVEVVPGVGTANAAAALLKRTLNLSGACTHTVLVSTRVLAEQPKGCRLEDLARPGATLLIYMNHYPLPELVARLRRGYGCNVPIVLAHRVGLPGQELLFGHLDDIERRAASRPCFAVQDSKALTLILVGEALSAAADAAWWDEHRDRMERNQP